jgi:glutathione S-transferase
MHFTFGQPQEGRMLELWELQGEQDCRYSTFAWRAKLALLHKGLQFQVRPVAVNDKAAIAFSGQDKVPILKHDDRVVFDSWSIAVYLERTFPDRPSLFGGTAGQTLAQFFNIWTDRELLPMLVPHLMLNVLDCVGPAAAAHHRGQMEKIFKRTLEELYGERDKGLTEFRRRLQPVRKVVERSPFLGGDRPAYADYVLFSLPQWARIVSNEPIFAPGDAVGVWFESVLDLYGGAGRNELSRKERMKEAA